MLHHILSAVPGVPEGRDYLTTGGAIIIALITTVGSVLGAQGWSNRKIIKSAAVSAEQAAERSEPTGNGWSARIEATLQRIEHTQTQHGKDIGGVRADVRAVSGRVDDITKRFNTHLDH